MSELKPCPFCGSEARAEWMDGEEQLDLCWVECGKCGASTVFCGQPELAIDAWNTRAERTCSNVNKGHSFTCSECGNYIDENDNYCPNCGARVVE